MQAFSSDSDSLTRLSISLPVWSQLETRAKMKCCFAPSLVCLAHHQHRHLKQTSTKFAFIGGQQLASQTAIRSGTCIRRRSERTIRSARQSAPPKNNKVHKALVAELVVLVAPTRLDRLSCETRPPVHGPPNDCVAPDRRFIVFATRTTALSSESSTASVCKRRDTCRAEFNQPVQWLHGASLSHARQP